RVHQLCAAPCGAPRRSAVAHKRDGHPRSRDARPGAGGIRERQARVRGRARPAAESARTVPGASGRFLNLQGPDTSASSSRNGVKTFNGLYTSSQVTKATKKPASSERLSRTLLTREAGLASFSERKARPSQAHPQATGRGVPKAFATSLPKGVRRRSSGRVLVNQPSLLHARGCPAAATGSEHTHERDRKSTRLNSSH